MSSGVKFGYELEWHDSRYLSTIKIAISDCESIIEAQAVCLAMAIKSGYRLPKWYEFWRWGENRPSVEEAVSYLYEESRKEKA